MTYIKSIENLFPNKLYYTSTTKTNQQNTSKCQTAMQKKWLYTWLNGFYCREAKLVYHLKVNDTYNINVTKKRMIISIKTEEVFDKM
jgi:hypothetical protein